MITWLEHFKTWIKSLRPKDLSLFWLRKTKEDSPYYTLLCCVWGMVVDGGWNFESRLCCPLIYLRLLSVSFSISCLRKRFSQSSCPPYLSAKWCQLSLHMPQVNLDASETLASQISAVNQLSISETLDRMPATNLYGPAWSWTRSFTNWQVET